MSLKTMWFLMTKAGIKTEDYREITPYWCSRLILVDGEKQTKIWWDIRLNHIDAVGWIKKSIINGEMSFVKIDINVMTLGYPSANDTDKFLFFKHAGIEIRTGNQEWGAEPNKMYFVIKHGDRI